MERPTKYYHGTIVPNLQEILPANTHGNGTIFWNVTDRNYAYATTDEHTAWHYAELAWNHRATGIPRVYLVEPTGDVECDPNDDAFSTDVRSRHPFRVVKELDMPESMGKPKDWI